MNPWLLLGGSIGLEIVATNLLKLSDGFTKPFPTAGALLIYALSFLSGVDCFSHTACRFGLCRVVGRGDYLNRNRCLLCLRAETRYACNAWYRTDYFRRIGD